MIILIIIVVIRPYVDIHEFTPTIKEPMFANIFGWNDSVIIVCMWAANRM